MAHDLETLLINSFKSAIDDYRLISPHDRILLAFSGGKDSFGLLKLFRSALVKNPPLIPPLDIYPVFIDPGFKSSPEWIKKVSGLGDYLSQHGYSLRIKKTEIIKKANLQGNKKNPCFICSRMR